MAIRIDKDGTIIRVPDEQAVVAETDCNEIASNGPSDYEVLTAVPVWIPPVFWIVTLVVSAGVCVAVFLLVSPVVFETTSSSGLIESIINFMCIVSPYLVFAGGMAATAYYNVKTLAKVDYRFPWWHFLLSVLCCVAGNIATGLALFLITLAIAIVVGILLIILGVAVVIGIFSGG